MIRADAPLETVPMFVRAGSIIPMGPEMNYIGEKPIDPVTFEIYPNGNGQAATALYEDDGTSPAYKQGVFRRTPVDVSSSGKGFMINVGAPVGSFNPGARRMVFVIKSMADARQVSVDGTGLGQIEMNQSQSGWYKVPGGIAVRIADDGRARQIQIR